MRAIEHTGACPPFQCHQHFECCCKQEMNGLTLFASWPTWMGLCGNSRRLCCLKSCQAAVAGGLAPNPRFSWGAMHCMARCCQGELLHSSRSHALLSQPQQTRCSSTTEPSKIASYFPVIRPCSCYLQHLSATHGRPSIRRAEALFCACPQK